MGSGSGSGSYGASGTGALGASPTSRGRRPTSRTQTPQTPTQSSSLAQSFIFEEGLVRIRQAELVVLSEEKKFGMLARDPEGRLMPRLQALTRTAAFELKKDDHRPITEPASTALYAPHAASSDIGVAPGSWTPDTDAPVSSNVTSSNVSRKATGTGGTGGTGDRDASGIAEVEEAVEEEEDVGNFDKPDEAGAGAGVGAGDLGAVGAVGTGAEDFAAAAVRQGQGEPVGEDVGVRRRPVPVGGYDHLYSATQDAGLTSLRRGQGKSGGLLAALSLRGADTRLRRPLKTTLTSDIEFKRTR
jgi:hypothetical protein